MLHTFCCFRMRYSAMHCSARHASRTRETLECQNGTEALAHARLRRSQATTHRDRPDILNRVFWNCSRVREKGIVRSRVQQLQKLGARRCRTHDRTGPIDAYYASQGLPKLEYRSLRFLEEYHEPEGGFNQPCLQLNYPGPEVEHTIIVEYKHKPNQPETARTSAGTVIFKEYSRDHGEPYYPVPNPANRELYEKYRDMASREPGVVFVGRLASYKYFNMNQAFLSALEIFDDHFVPFESPATSTSRTALGEPDAPK